jgi:hypothetical protein
MWAETPKSLSALLSEGWRITAMDNHQVFKREGEEKEVRRGDGIFLGLSRTLAATPDGNEYNFLLEKESKWIVCILSSPTLDASHSRCRMLN